MKQLQRSFLMLLIFALCAIPAPAQQKTGLQEKLKRIEEMIQQEMQKSGAPGIAVAIEQDGKLVYSKGFGYADVENKVPFTPQTVSRIGSISKTFTALSVMQLVEQGKIKVDDEVQVYVPTFPKKSAPITIRQLLCHQSGIRHYNGQEFLSARHYANVEEALAVFKDDSLGFVPGTQFGYTTYGYSLLSRVVEAGAGISFPEYLKQHIFTPLGLKQTWLDDQPLVIPQRARNYTKRQNGPVENAPQVDQSNKWGGGGLLSTVEDLLRYADSYDGKQLLKPETIAQMFTAQKTSDGKTTGYGLGWGIGMEDGRRLVEHTGGSAGATSALAKYPDQKTTIAVLVNNDFNTGPQFKAKIAKILFEP